MFRLWDPLTATSASFFAGTSSGGKQLSCNFIGINPGLTILFGARPFRRMEERIGSGIGIWNLKELCSFWFLVSGSWFSDEGQQMQASRNNKTFRFYYLLLTSFLTRNQKLGTRNLRVIPLNFSPDSYSQPSGIEYLSLRKR